MKKRWRLWQVWMDWTSKGLALSGGAMFALNCPGQVPGSEPSGVPSAPAAIMMSAPLEYQETAYAFQFRNVPVERRAGAFPKEPARVSTQVSRGVLKFGGNLANAVPFLWQPNARKLCLDLHRNQDLTGATEGTFIGRPQGPQFVPVYHQVFTNIYLSFPATSTGAPMLMDLDFFQYGDSGSTLVHAMGRSFWQGKVTVDGKDWQVGLVQNLSGQPGSFLAGQLLLRPAAVRNEGFCVGGEVPEDCALPWCGKNEVARASDGFAFSPNVFFEGHAWQLDWSAEPRGREEKLALRMAEQPTGLGKLQITGSFIHRLVLTGEPYVVVLDQPRASVQIPPGRYQAYRVWLKQAETRAYFEYGLPQSGKANVVQAETGAQMPVVSLPPPEQAVVVDAQRPAVMEVGGPLTNCVSAARRGRNLLLNYRLIGAGGAQYWLAGGGIQQPPHFMVSRSGRSLGTGKFEFG